MSRIVVSFPSGPNAFPQNSVSWAQMSYHMFKALKETFDNVIFMPMQNTKLHGSDILITCVVHPMLPKWKRSIIVYNDNFLVNKWKHGKFKRYGLEFKTDCVSGYDRYIKNVQAVIIKSNDVALRRWKNNDPLILAKKNWLINNVKSVNVVPHPIDKKFYSRHYNANRKTSPKMLVYHAGWRKNAKHLIDLLKASNMSNFDVVSKITMSDVRIKAILNEYSYIAHISVSEGFPYLANELMCQGLVLYGHDDWWNGYGNQDLCWSYDPKKQELNKKNLTKLLTLPSKDCAQLRKQQWDQHMSRTDNNWDYFNNILLNEVKKLL